MTPEFNRVLLIASFEGCPRVWKMASALSEKNFSVTVLEWDRSARLPVSEKVGAINVRRMRFGAPYGSKLFLLLPFWWIYISIFLASNRFDIIQPQNLDNLFPSWVSSRINRTKIVYDIADFYADAYVPTNLFLLRKVIGWIERLLIANVNYTLIVDDSRIRQLSPSSCVSTIYNSPPDSVGLKSKVSNESLNSEFTLFYGGILCADRGLEMMVEAVRNLTGFRLLVAGFGRLETQFFNVVRDIKNVQFLGRVSYNDILDLTSMSDCVMALYDPAVPNNVYASPNKLFEAMLCGKPIIVSAGTAMADIVKREQCGFVVEYGDVKTLRDLLIAVKEDPHLLTIYGENGRSAYVQRYSWSLMETKLLKIYNKISVMN